MMHGVAVVDTSRGAYAGFDSLGRMLPRTQHASSCRVFSKRLAATSPPNQHLDLKPVPTPAGNPSEPVTASTLR